MVTGQFLNKDSPRVPTPHRSCPLDLRQDGVDSTRQFRGADQFSNSCGTGILPVAEKHGQDARATINGVAQPKQLIGPPHSLLQGKSVFKQTGDSWRSRRREVD